MERPMKTKFLLSLLLAFAATTASASVSYSNGVLTLNVSGYDAQTWGGRGGSAGSATVNLAYTDQSKTSVLISGTTSSGGPFSRTVAFSDLHGVRILAVGGNGANGMDGQD